jgi:formylglycine-generating enzyme required for sulfatase activity
MADIFISYASEDRSRAELLAKALKEQGWSVFWDRKIPPGKTWDEIIEEAIEAAKCIIVVWTKESVNSGWVRAEAQEGLDREILVPVKFDNIKIPLRFRPVQAANLIGWEKNKSATGFRQLIQALASILGGSPEPEKSTELIEAAGQDLSEKTESFKNSIGMEFVLIPAGRFMMGGNFSPEETAKKYGRNARYFKREHPQHKVTISKPFYLQSTQVTQSQWEKIMGNNPSGFEDCGDNCPVENVSWDDAQDFIRRLNEKEATVKYRLSTEAEWEYACRAGTTTEFSFGDGVDKLEDYAWYNNISEDITHPVGQKIANPWGLYDMHGNVWEWCQDWYGDYPSNPVVDPQGLDKSDRRVLRGGSWFDGTRSPRSAFRERSFPYDRDDSFGFRVARDL